jgi:hypothetical protein
MKRSNSPVVWCAGLSTGILIALAIAPATGWLTRLQAGAMLAIQSDVTRNLHDLGVGGQDPNRAAAHAEAQRKAADRAPDDFAVQMAAARSGIPAGAPAFASESDASLVSQADRIRTLADRFSTLPDYYATVTRLDTLGRVRITRTEGDRLTAKYTPRKEVPRTSSAPEQLARFEADCAAGERLDPGNAYFPTMRAVVLFEMKRDAEAVAALRRAGKLNRWDDYVRNEVIGPMRLAQLSGGDRTALYKVAVSAAVLLPHFAQLRSLARMATWKAVQAETGDQPKEGLAIRRDIMRIGANLRANSTTSIGVLVGTAIVHLAASRPGGAPAVQRSAGGTNQQTARERDKAFTDFARRNGETELAAWAVKESEAEETSRNIITRGINLSTFGTPAISRLMRGWIADLIAISNAIWLLLLSAAAAVYLRWRKAREEAGIHHDDRFVLAAAGGALALAMFVLITKQTGVLASYFNAARVFTNLFAGNSGSPNEDMSGTVALAAASVLAAPLLVVFISAIVTAVRRRPILPGIASGLRAVGPPLALMLVIGYGYLVVQTSRHEREISDGVDQTVQHEGRYLARLLNSEWPGLVPFAAANQGNAKQE